MFSDFFSPFTLTFDNSVKGVGQWITLFFYGHGLCTKDAHLSYSNMFTFGQKWWAVNGFLTLRLNYLFYFQPLNVYFSFHCALSPPHIGMSWSRDYYQLRFSRIINACRSAAALLLYIQEQVFGKSNSVNMRLRNNGYHCMFDHYMCALWRYFGHFPNVLSKLQFCFLSAFLSLSYWISSLLQIHELNDPVLSNVSKWQH